MNKIKTICAFGKEINRQVFWLRNFLRKYRNEKSIGYWENHKAEWLKIQGIENWIKTCWRNSKTLV